MDFKEVRSFGKRGSAPGQFKNPRGLAFDRAGNLYVADTSNNRIQIVSTTGEYITEIQPVRKDGKVQYLTRVMISDDGDRIFVYDQGGDHMIFRF